uniref:hypothetical protein n=1 Tax=Dixoniella grisea TaxID=35153 RepID=UPI001FCE241D|nr:hypothetical protein MW560_pgp005 [Dixoniella grisea]UNJ17226.1 hypothetical protein [Dixoniella grisea]
MINFFKLTLQFIYFFFISLVGLLITIISPLMQTSNKRENWINILLLFALIGVLILIFKQMLSQPLYL